MSGKRPWKVCHVPTGRVHSFGSDDAALARVALLGGLPSEYQGQYVMIGPDGITYDVPGLLATMRTIARIHDISKAFVAARR